MRGVVEWRFFSPLTPQVPDGSKKIERIRYENFRDELKTSSYCAWPRAPPDCAYHPAHYTLFTAPMRGLETLTAAVTAVSLVARLLLLYLLRLGTVGD